MQAKRKPNSVVVFVDDRGCREIEPFGSKVNKTPHLNRMADEGIKLASFHVAEPCCTSSRAALMTGCPKRVGLATASVGRPVLFPKASHGLNPDKKACVWDFGRTFNGRVRFQARGPAGTRVSILHDTVRGTVVSYTTFPPNDPMREWKAWTQDIQNMFGSAFYLFSETLPMEAGAAVFAIGSGSYAFVSRRMNKVECGE